MRYRLGKKTRKDDRRTLRMEDYFGPASIPTPPISAWGSPLTGKWLMLLNDQYSNCVIAAAMEMVRVWYSQRGIILEPTNAEALANYKNAWLAQNPGQTFQDNGLFIVNFLNYWRQTGIMVGGVLHKNGAFATVNAKDPQRVMQAIQLGIGVLAGLELPICAETQFDEGLAWDVENGSEGVVGSLGGHCVPWVEYQWIIGPTGPRAVTWGQKIRQTWAAAASWCDECYCIFSMDILNPNNGKTPAGFDQAAFLADLSVVSLP